MNRLICFLALAAPAACWADIQYTVTPSGGRLEIEMRIPVRDEQVVVQSPNWAPGSYVLANNYERIENLKAFGSTPLAITRVNNHTWSIPAQTEKEVRVTYSVELPTRGRFPSHPEEEILHYSGPSTYLYVQGRLREKCRLEFKVPSTWKIAVGLEEAEGENVFEAPDYDVLADNPVTLGKYLELRYTVEDKPHIIALRGAARGDVDLKRLLEACRKITESQSEFFGGLPYDRFVWHFLVNNASEGASGLEHLTSTQITFGSGLSRRAISVLSHEFFHVWNVKRIRSKPLGPFDYTQLPKTGALWWLEGVTDYYADLLLLRAGMYTREEFFNDLVSNVRSVRANAARLEVSPYESSLRVAETNNGRGNSSGYRVSYYNTGWVVGLCLDLELRSRTQGRRSLDDVMLALWELTRDGKPGFEEDEIRRQLVRFGGNGMGQYYDRVVMQPGDLPVEEGLQKMGLVLEDRDQRWTNTGITVSASVSDRAMRVASANGPAENLLQTGDLIVSASGRSLELATAGGIARAWAEAQATAEPGRPFRLKVKREDKVRDVVVTPVQATRKVLGVHARSEQPLREAWLGAKISTSAEALPAPVPSRF